MGPPNHLSVNVNSLVILQIGVSDASVTVEDGRIRCTFTRQISRDGGMKDNFYNLKNPNKYHIIMAKSNGDLLADGKFIMGLATQEHGSRSMQTLSSLARPLGSNRNWCYIKFPTLCK